MNLQPDSETGRQAPTAECAAGASPLWRDLHYHYLLAILTLATVGASLWVNRAMLHQPRASTQPAAVAADPKQIDGSYVPTSDFLIAALAFATAMTAVAYARDARGKVLRGKGKLRAALAESQANATRAEDALREYSTLQSALDKHTIMSVADRSGKITYVNAGFMEISGYTREELVGQDHRIINSGHHDAGFWTAVWRQLVVGLPWRGEVCNRAKNGSLYWVDSTIVPIVGADGRPDRYISIRFDVTGRKRAEAVATERAKLHQTQLEAIDKSQGRIEFNAAGEVIAVNELYLRMTGEKAEDLLGRHHDTLYPEDLSDEDDRLWDQLDYLSDSVEAMRLRTQDGSECWAHVTYSPVVDEQGNVIKVVKYAIDVSAQKRLENDLDSARRLEALGQLAAGVAHEINTPLQAVISNIEFLQMTQERCIAITDLLLKVPQEDDDCGPWVKLLQAAMASSDYGWHATEQPQAIEEASLAADRVREVVHAMRSLSHPGSEATNFNANEIIQQAVTISRNRWGSVAKATLELNEDLPEVMGNASELSQVAINLIVNAADAIAEHGGEGEGEIRLRTERHDDESVLLEISDNGPGIPEEVVDRVFEPFFTTKDVGKGTGQGLALSWDIIVNRFGGSISVASEPGEGATFRILLPIYRSTSSHESSEVAVAATS